VLTIGITDHLVIIDLYVSWTKLVTQEETQDVALKFLPSKGTVKDKSMVKMLVFY